MWKFGLNALVAVLGLALFVATPNAEEQMSSGRGRALGDNVGRLIQQLEDENPHTRMQAADALGQIKDVRAIEPLIAALKDKDSLVRERAADALGQIKGARAVGS